MFSMPPGEDDRSREGYSDDSPVILQGETVERFAELIAVLYAL